MLPSGTVTIAAGAASETVTVEVQGDTDFEPNEGFTLTLSAPVNGAIVDGVATATIENDDAAPAPEVSLSPLTLSQPEGDAGPTAFTFTVERTGIDLSQATTVAYAVTGSGGQPATADDFAGGVLPSGTVTIAAGAASETVTVEVQGDTDFEPNEGFTLTLSAPVNGAIVDGVATATIENDDAAPAPEVSLSPLTLSQPEGDAGPTAFTFTVERAGIDLSQATTVAYAVTGGGGQPATADDFAGGVLPSGTVTIAAGAASETVTVEVQGDTDFEPNEGFTLTLSAPVNGAIVDGVATASIENDDADDPGEPDLIPVRISFKSEDAGFANAFGIYDKSTMKAELLAPDLNATAEGGLLYEADLTQEQLDDLGFFLLPNGGNANADLASLLGEELMVENIAGVYAVTANGAPLSGSGAPAFFSDAAWNPGGLDHFVEDGTPAAYCLSVEDLKGGGDLDFDDALFLVETGVPMTGAEVKVTFEGESAGFRNTFGYFVEGTDKAGIVFADLDETTLAPGTMETFALSAEEYKKLEFFLIPDGANKNADLFADLDAIDLIVEEVGGVLQARDETTDTVLEGYVNPVYVPAKSGNPDATRHALKVGDVDDFKLSWEDLPAGGDKDYNDTVVGVQITPDDLLV